MYGLYSSRLTRGDVEQNSSKGALPSFSCQVPLHDGDDGDDEESIARKETALLHTIHVNWRPSVIEVNLREESSELSRQLQFMAHQHLANVQRSFRDFDEDTIVFEDHVKVEQPYHHKFLEHDGTSIDEELAARRQELRAFLRKKHQEQAQKESLLISELESQERKAREIAKKESQAKQVEELAPPLSKTLPQQTGQPTSPASTREVKDTSLKSQSKTDSQIQRFKLCGSSETLTAFNTYAELISQAQEVATKFQGDPSMKDAKRAINKFVTLNVQQISATVEQVILKTRAFVGFLSQHSEPQRTYTMLSLASKLLSQCEVQITRLHSFAFPLAEVVVGVGCSHNNFMSLFLGRLHAACPLTMPLVYEANDGRSDSEAKLRMGYRVIEDASVSSGKSFETTDDYLTRVQGYVMLYAAITQSSQPSNPHALQHAWAFMARLLNDIPTSRTSATCLDAFLKIAGYRLAQRYGRQFHKLLHVVQNSFLKELDSIGDANTRAVSSRIRTYISTQRYSTPPEGWQMPQRDVSSYDRA